MTNNLRVERAIKNITQEELAKIVGVSRQTINSIQSNKYVLSTVLALKISEYFAKSVLLVYFFIESAKNRDEKNPKIDIKITSPFTPAPLILLSAIK